MSEHRDHRWSEVIEVHAHLGFSGDQRCFCIVGPEAINVAVTGQIHALARLHPPGTRLRIGRQWIQRMYENAEKIEDQQADHD